MLGWINSGWSLIVAARALVRIGLVVGCLLGALGPAEAVSFTVSEIAGDTLTDARASAFAAAWPAGLLAGQGLLAFWRMRPGWRGQLGQPG